MSKPRRPAPQHCINTTLDALMETALDVFVRPDTIHVDELPALLFPPDVLERCRIGWQVANRGFTNSRSYPVTGDGFPQTHVTIGGWRNREMLEPRPEFVAPQPGHERLFALLESVNAICVEASAVAAVASWFVKNATWAATRYYFPAITTLVGPDLQDLFGSDITRFKDCPGVGAIMPLVREASVIVAKWAMLRGAPAPERSFSVAVSDGRAALPQLPRFAFSVPSRYVAL